MGVLGQLGSGFSDIHQGAAKAFGSNKDRREARDREDKYYEDKEGFLAGYNRLDRSPTYQSDLIGPYQRTQSPAARAYLESLLTGDSPDAAAAPWAAGGDVDAAKQRQQEKYGNLSSLVAQGERDRATTPWATKRPEEPEDRTPSARASTYTGKPYGPDPAKEEARLKRLDELSKKQFWSV